MIALDISPDGRLVYLADGRELQVWTTNPVRHLRTLATLTVKEDHEPQGVEVVPSPDGRYVATVLDEQVAPIRRGGWRCGLDLPRLPHTPAGFPKQVILWDTKTWERVHDQAGSGMRRFMWAADGRFGAFSDWQSDDSWGDRMSEYEVEYTDPRRRLTSRYRLDFDTLSPRRETKLSGDGRLVARWAGAGDLGEFELHDVTARRPPREMFIGRPLHRIQFTNDCRFLITLHRDQSVRLFDLCGATQSDANRTQEQLWGDLVSDDAGTVFRAARVLIERGNEVVSFLKSMGEQRAGVRAERIQEWIVRLGDPDYHTREAATRDLAAHMHDAEPHLRAARPASLEAADRLERLLSRTPPPTAETRRTRWLVYVLEQIHSESSVAVLREWAARPMPFGLTAEAARAVRDVTNGHRAINP